MRIFYTARAKAARIGLALAVATLAACIGIDGPGSPPASGDTCGAHAFTHQVGRQVVELELPPGSRMIGPDTIITEDFVPARLNVLVDGRGTVRGLRCG